MNETNNIYNEDREQYAPGPVSDTVFKTEPRKKRKGAGRIVALALCCSLLGGTVGATGTLLAISGADGDGIEEHESVINESEHSAASLSAVNSSSDRALTASEIYERNVNSTVGITTSVTTNYFGFRTTSAASGSGFIVTSDGYIVTNYHVIEDASTVKVTAYDGTAYDAVIVGGDEENDIAVLKVDAQGLTPVTLGSSDELKVGDDVVAIGNPLGELTFSLTKGVVSALDRKVTMSSGISMELIQTDCAINSGNSGGALFNMYGEVVGITNAKFSGNSSGEASIDNIGFAIPVDNVRDLIREIIEKGYVSEPYIGVSLESVSDDMAVLGLPEGAIIRGVTQGSPAASAGLRVNDIVTAVNGKAINSSEGLKEAVSKSAPGDTLTCTVYRAGKTLELTVTVAEKAQSVNGESEERDTGARQGYPNSFPRGGSLGL